MDDHRQFLLANGSFGEVPIGILTPQAVIAEFRNVSCRCLQSFRRIGKGPRFRRVGKLVRFLKHNVWSVGRQTPRRAELGGSAEQ